MNKAATILLTTGLLLPPLLAAVAADPAKPSTASGAPTGRVTYDSFRLVHTRNVFDPDRRPVRPVNSGPAVPSGPTFADYAALTGTMIGAEKSYAFFSGSRPEFNKVLSVQDKFANATVASINGQNIEIERDGKRTTILVGQTVPFDNQTQPGEPPVEAAPPAEVSVSADVSARPAPPAASAPTTNYYNRGGRGGGNYGGGNNGGGYGNRGGGGGNNAAGAAPAAAPAGPPGNVEEIRRRMMEKRQQELK